MLRTEDQAYLDNHGIDFEMVSDSEGTHLILRQVSLPLGLEPNAVDVLITLPPGFNDVGPDMFWLHPFATRSDGQGIPGADSTRDFQGRVWQRWSRHIGPAWRPGVDNVATYIAYVKRALADVAARAA